VATALQPYASQLRTLAAARSLAERLIASILAPLIRGLSQRVNSHSLDQVEGGTHSYPLLLWELGWETGRCRMARATAPILDSASTAMPAATKNVRC
jgi:hypothetical protein